MRRWGKIISFRRDPAIVHNYYLGARISRRESTPSSIRDFDAADRIGLPLIVQQHPAQYHPNTFISLSRGRGETVGGQRPARHLVHCLAA